MPGFIPVQRVKIHYVDSELLETEGLSALDGMHAILVPGGFGERGIEGKVLAVQYAREHLVPYLGICLGMQAAVIEFARNMASLAGAHSTEFDPATPHPVIALITEWKTAEGSIENRAADGDVGGTMRLGGQPCKLAPDSYVARAYGTDLINERHRHRYEFNNTFMMELEAAGLRIAGRSIDGNLVEIVEIPRHPWFVGCQFHPEFTSTPRDGHPLFTAFISAALTYKTASSAEAIDAIV